MLQYTKTNTILKCEDVSITLGGKKILSDINFEVKDVVRPDCTQGQIISLIGRSGVGKSTLFNALAGLYTLNAPNTGSILVGKEQRPVKVGDMGVVYQNYYLYEHRRLKWILNNAIVENTQIAEGDRTAAVNEVAEQFDLTKLLDTFPGDMSGGQKQRAAIAEQLLNGGDFLLLDEPFSGLDILMIRKVVDLLLKVSLTDELKTLIIVSHDIANAVAISDTVLLLNHKENDVTLGATIIEEIDLIERNLAWHTDIKKTPEFIKTISEIESKL